MKKSLLMLLFFVVLMQIHAEVNLKMMSNENRNEYLLSLAKEVVLNFGPDFYRTEQAPIIEGPTPFYFYRSADEEKEHWDDIPGDFRKISGREYYTVKYQYDKDELSIGGTVDGDYCAKVEIWADSGDPASVMFGTGYGRPFYTKSYLDFLKEYEGRMEKVRAKYPQNKYAGHLDGTVDTIPLKPIVLM